MENWLRKTRKLLTSWQLVRSDLSFSIRVRRKCPPVNQSRTTSRSWTTGKENNAGKAAVIIPGQPAK